MNVFVLGTGRCGSVTFARACEHLTNFTSGHESRARLIGEARLGYPPQHIEVDNRLSWFLGSLGHRFADDAAFYVHLWRDPELVIDSFVRRWNSPFRASIMRAFGHGIVMRTADWADTEVRDVCETYVTTVLDNIDEFLLGRPSLQIDIDTASDSFVEFATTIRASGNLDAAVDEFTVRHNASGG